MEGSEHPTILAMQNEIAVLQQDMQRMITYNSQFQDQMETNFQTAFKNANNWKPTA